MIAVLVIFGIAAGGALVLLATLAETALRLERIAIHIASRLEDIWIHGFRDDDDDDGGDGDDGEPIVEVQPPQDAVAKPIPIRKSA